MLHRLDGPCSRVAAAGPTVLFVALAVALAASPGAAQTPPAGASPVPEEFSPADAIRAQELRGLLRPFRERLLAPGTSDDEVRAVAAEASPLADELATLERKRWLWQCHVEGRDPGAGPIAAGAELRAAGAPAAPLDRSLLYTLFEEFARMDRARGSGGAQAPAAASWEELANRLRPLTTRPFELDPSSDGPWVLRSALLLGQCWLRASVEYSRAGDRVAQHRTYVEGLSALERVLLAFRAARATHESGVDACELLEAPPPPHQGVELAGVAPRGLGARLLGPGQTPTSQRAQELLTEFCPWGLGLYTALHQLGLTRELDWRILPPYAHDELQYVSVAAVTGGVPANAKRRMDAVVEGRLLHLGKLVLLDWERRPKDATFTVWFTSPEVSRIRVSKLVTWGLRAVKLLVGGPLDLLADETMGHLVDQIGAEYGSDSQVYAAAGLAVDLNNYGLESDFLIDGKDFSRGKPAKETLMSLLRWIEDRTIELTFEGIDPENEQLRSQVGGPLSYDGSPIPPVLLRGDVLGFERVPDHRYRHTWNVLSFHQLDPRGLAGSGRYDLSTRLSSGMEGLAAYLRGGVDAHSQAWPELPDPLGTRLVLGDFTPMVQVLRLAVEPEILSGWRSAVGEEQTLVALLYPGDGRGQPVAFHEIEGPEVSFRINNTIQLIRGGPGKERNVFLPEKAHASWDTRDPRCDYTVKVAVARKTAAYTHAGEWGWSSDIFWAEPVKILESRTGRFLSRGGAKRTGTLSYPSPGCVVLNLAARRSTVEMRMVGPTREELATKPLDGRWGMERSFWVSVRGLPEGLHRMRVQLGDGRTYTSWGYAQPGSSTDFRGWLYFTSATRSFHIEFSLPDMPDVEPLVLSGTLAAKDHGETMAAIGEVQRKLAAVMASLGKPERQRPGSWRTQPVSLNRELAELHLAAGMYQQAREDCVRALEMWDQTRPTPGDWRYSPMVVNDRLAVASYALADAGGFEQAKLAEARHTKVERASTADVDLANLYMFSLANGLAELGGDISRVGEYFRLGLGHRQRLGENPEEVRRTIAESSQRESLYSLVRAGRF